MVQNTPAGDAENEPAGRIRLSVLDQSPIPEGSTGGDALRNSVDLARLADGSATTATGSPSTTARRPSPAPAPR